MLNSTDVHMVVQSTSGDTTELPRGITPDLQIFGADISAIPHQGSESPEDVLRGDTHAQIANITDESTSKSKGPLGTL